MKILGINAFGHDTSAALVIDGVLIAAIEEERLNREKKTRKFPHLSIEYCLGVAGIKLKDIDYVTYAYVPSIWFTHRFLLHQARYFPQALTEMKYFGKTFKEHLLLESTLKKELGMDIPIKFIKHHNAHMGSTFLVSPHESSAIMTIDGLGEYESCVHAVGSGSNIKRINHVNFPYSLGMMYSCLSQFLNYAPTYDEGKVMGLSSYGDRDEYYNDFKKIVRLKSDGTYDFDMSYFMYHRTRDVWVSDKFYKVFGAQKGKNEDINDRHMAVIAAGQRVLEDTILHMTESLHKKTKQDAICIAGGVALNSVTNGKILEQGYFKDIFVQPASSDDGLAIGSAFYLYNTLKKNSRKYVMSDSYLGPRYSVESIKDALDQYNLPVYESCNVASEVAHLLSKGNVIGLYQGKMEFGPRALGNRSIIADPRSAEMKDIVNSKIKFRESFRPFAPAILKERCADFFDNDYTSPYMLLVYKVRESMKHLIPAVVHADNTGRVQTVTERDNKRYYNIIKEFGDITGVPVILNTSFNIKDEPIVCFPEDAVRCFLGTDIDVLVMEDYIVKKTDINMEDFDSPECYRHKGKEMPSSRF